MMKNFYYEKIKRLVKGIKIVLKKKNKKSNSMVVNYIKTFPNMKKKDWLRIKKMIMQKSASE